MGELDVDNHRSDDTVSAIQHSINDNSMSKARFTDNKFFNIKSSPKPEEYGTPKLSANLAGFIKPTTFSRELSREKSNTVGSFQLNLPEIKNEKSVSCTDTSDSRVIVLSLKSPG